MADKISPGTVAVMDLGTNTFHLLIARGDAANPEILFHTTIPVKLGDGGINNGLILPAAYKRGLDAILKFHKHILKYSVDHIKAAATSALRTTSNGKDFIYEVRIKTGIIIETIDGEREAEYIYEGVKAGNCLTDKNALIIDIGGGSVEFIIGNNEQILWKHSFEIGAARLMDKFHKTDPIRPSSVKYLNNYLGQTLRPLFDDAADIQIGTIIGSSGAFETFAEVIELKKGNKFDLEKNREYHFDYDEFINLTNWLVISTHPERENTKGIIPIRIDMIVVAALLTRFVMRKLGIKDVVMSSYSLKEGLMSGMLR